MGEALWSLLRTFLKLFFLRRLSEKWTLVEWSGLKLRLAWFQGLLSDPVKLPLVLACAISLFSSSNLLKQVKISICRLSAIIITLITIKEETLPLHILFSFKTIFQAKVVFDTFVSENLGMTRECMGCIQYKYKL